MLRAQQHKPPFAPALSEHSTWYDKQSNKIFTYGGYDLAHPQTSSAALWEFNLNNCQFVKVEAVQNKSSPGDLIRHASCMRDGVLYVFGGLSQAALYNLNMYQFNMQRQRWSVLRAKNAIPQAGAEMSSAYVEDVDMWYFFGGVSSSNANFLNTVQRFDFAKNRWQELSPMPYALASHTSCLHNKHIYVFGGHNASGYHNSLYDYSVADDTWTLIKCNGNPPPRSHHASDFTASGSHFVVFAGWQRNGDVEKFFDDFWILDMASKTWQQFKLETVHSRSDCTFVNIKNNEFLLFGGFNPDFKHCYNDVFFVTLEVSQNPTSPIIPNPPSPLLDEIDAGIPAVRSPSPIFENEPTLQDLINDVNLDKTLEESLNFFPSVETLIPLERSTSDLNYCDIVFPLLLACFNNALSVEWLDAHITAHHVLPFLAAFASNESVKNICFKHLMRHEKVLVVLPALDSLSKTILIEYINFKLQPNTHEYPSKPEANKLVVSLIRELRHQHFEDHFLPIVSVSNQYYNVPMFLLPNMNAFPTRILPDMVIHNFLNYIFYHKVNLTPDDAIELGLVLAEFAIPKASVELVEKLLKHPELTDTQLHNMIPIYERLVPQVSDKPHGIVINNFVARLEASAATPKRKKRSLAEASEPASLESTPSKRYRPTFMPQKRNADVISLDDDDENEQNNMEPPTKKQRTNHSTNISPPSNHLSTQLLHDLNSPAIPAHQPTPSSRTPPVLVPSESIGINNTSVEENCFLDMNNLMHELQQLSSKQNQIIASLHRLIKK